jgi:hypothetical protein
MSVTKASQSYAAKVVGKRSYSRASRRKEKRLVKDEVKLSKLSRFSEGP